SLLSRVGREQKKTFKAIFQKSSQRDLGQVLANGGLAGILVLMWNYFPGEQWYFLYLGTLAAVTADTWATEIGVFSRKWPRLILNFKPVPPGTSGGISPLGTSAAMAGALIISLVGWLVSEVKVKLFLLIILAGLLASMFDSLLGATIQAQFQCPRCHKITERSSHCNGAITLRVSGWKWVTNDVVNLACALFGMALVWVGIKIL
ncbi:MAG: DUF92 domain-containing protein, partial [candidate division KSB1 bacterium]|nr:DUF92 domain-containing protein [candidate division KSB1 bacterium]